MNNIRINVLSLLLACCVVFAYHAAIAQNKNIKNDRFWYTKDSLPIYSQGGGIFRFADPVTNKQKYYWYGVHYTEAGLYRNAPDSTYSRATFESVTCYSSSDLVNWTFEADVLNKKEVNKAGPTWVGRLGVAYIKELKKYAMVVQHGSRVLFAVADSPTGRFTWHQEISMLDLIGTTNTGDQTVFTDDDGKSYLVYSYGRGRNRIYVSEIGVKDGKINLLDCKQVFQGEGREGNCMFKYKNRYYMAASNLYGWDASLVYYLVADDIRGPYLPANDMKVMDGAAEDYGHITQTGFFYTLKGTEQETVIYCGDRWADFAGNGLGYNQWVPLSFNGANPYFNSLHSWNLDEKTGKWTVAKDNDFVKNGSFEADRKLIPSTVKPVQEQLTGWATTVIEGNAIAVGGANSPVLNYSNTASDRKIVTGEKSLNLSDQTDFKRKTFQVITSTPFVQLPDGNYTLTAKVKNSKGFHQLVMYAETGGKKFEYAVKQENNSWQAISIRKIAVRAGKIEIGFFADGTAGSFCYVDDVSLVKD